MPRPKSNHKPAGRPRKFSDAAMLAALTEKKGHVHIAARQLGCTPKTIYDRAKINPDIDELIKNEKGIVNDVAELKLYDAILAGEPWAIQFQLRGPGRDRGYGDEHKIKVEGVRLQLIEEIVPSPLLDDGNPPALNHDGNNSAPDPPASGPSRLSP